MVFQVICHYGSHITKLTIMSGMGQQLLLLEIRSNYKQQIRHAVPTQGRMCFHPKTFKILILAGRCKIDEWVLDLVKIEN